MLMKIKEDGNSEGEEEQPVSKVPRTGLHVDGGGSGKAKRLQWMRQEREAKGLLLLPEKVERRIYLMKKAMRKKGLPGEQIKEAVRKMRRKEELLFRRQLAKECPEMEKNKIKTSEESEVAADIVSIGQSADAENIVPLHQSIQLKKEKVVSF
ncbi:hypothetical protein HPB52_020407 [Rhipicephalus sanguineus]|uniref:Uncharacterized protein n=1 Tax=Rhipicephalus sanguineus TaxID=34632 RepID=A0A9D4T1K0_RHISA|nr:hypothetical protein HPB52_020407 [Rhipicephalus sanguineus]